MIARILLFIIALLPFANPVQAAIWDNITGYFKGSPRKEAPSIRILVLHDAESANLSIRGKYSLFDPYTNSHISSRFAGKSRTIQALRDGLKWGEAFPGLFQLKIVPKEDSTLFTVNGNDYDGLIYVYDIGGTISIVNQIPVEDYVRSIISNFQTQNLEGEALAALAIAARTNAYFQAVNPKNTYWAVDAQKVGFQGLVNVNSTVENALAQTKYMIMSRTGVYEGIATPFAAQFGNLSQGQASKDLEPSQISLEEANAMAKKGEHAAQILAKAFPGSTIMLMQYSN